MGGVLGKVMDPIGAVAPGLSPAKVAARKMNAPFLDPTNAFKDPPQQKAAKRTDEKLSDEPAAQTLLGKK